MTASEGERRPQAPLSVCIIACKDLSLNMRTIRQARSLAHAGHRVTIVGYKAPDPRLGGDRAVASLVATGNAPAAIVLTSRLWTQTRILRDEAGAVRLAEAAVARGGGRTGIYARRAGRKLAGQSFDIVQGHFDRSLIAAESLARRSGARLVFDAVEVPFDVELLPRDPTSRAMRIAEIGRESAIARRADAWITVNESIADNIVERFGVARPFVLRNLADEGYWPSDGRLRRDIGLGADACILLHLNTLRRGEGVETIIDALARLPEHFHLVALGPTPQRPYLRDLRRHARKLGLASRFHLVPMQPASAVLPYIAGADIGVIARQGGLQNLRLSLPNRLFQLIAARLPVAVTPLHEISRLVRQWGAGVVFEEADAADLAAAIRKIADPDEYRHYRDAADRAAKALTWQREGQRYVEFIEQLGQGAFPSSPACPADQRWVAAGSDSAS